ncbi:transglycosylase SLT domain-containing protein [Massilibacteroides sp.]|uniref:transglycosylase SLT domain-containing protein n=1 Tax=Massilibacteroides sp. TaxID=2034766 RepID=UPI002628AB14|nr:transglycosylase SLT domain-containing protein [Massilibacteroides sp.]MDD4514284.1 transglycosylase SLT domain-containing protein [Massilibacteroides sp.]
MIKKELLCLFIFSILFGCIGRKDTEMISIRSFDQIKESGEIKAVTLYGSTSYFQYKMQEMGYEYDLIHDFAKSQDLKLTILIAESVPELIEMIKTGKADVAAYPIFINNELKKDVLSCGYEELTSQVLIQRANKGDKILKDVTELIGKEIHVKANSKYSERLQNLNEELGGDLIIREVYEDSVTTEDLIEMVSKGEIAYTVSDDNLARLNKTYYWNINIGLKISFMQRSSWMVNKENNGLADAIDEWSSNNTSKRAYRSAMKRYFELSKMPDITETPEIKNGHISRFDESFKKHAKSIGWDWRLLASIAYQESRFNPNVVSWAGAEGLMGIMPGTARGFGISPHELQDPDIAIHTAVRCLLEFRKGLKNITDPEEKIKFTLAAYNAGIGHIYDAQRLAIKYGKSPTLWENNVVDYIRLKSEPTFYNDSVCRHGYLRGSETANYVKEVMKRFTYYKNVQTKS